MLPFCVSSVGCARRVAQRLPNRLLTPLELVVELLEVPELPESVTELAVIVPLLPVIPSTTMLSPGWIALLLTLSDFVIFDSGVVTTATVLPLVSVT